MSKKEEAISLVERFCYYHAGTAITVGACGGQFGLDRVPLTALTVKMILNICDIYEIKDNWARMIHVSAAIARLTVNGTTLGHTILNWIPGGCFVNGATTFFLTRNAGMKCINEIEQGNMTVNKQLIQAGKDLSAIAIIHGISDYMDITDLADNEIEMNIQEALSISSLDDCGITELLDKLNNIPNEAIVGINKFAFTSFKMSLASAIQNDFKKIDIISVTRTAIFNSIIAIIDEHNTLSQEEIAFRIQQKNGNFANAFESFIENTTNRFDKLEKERGQLEAIRYLISAISDGYKIYFGLTSKEVLGTILDNPYDNELEKYYCHFINNMKKDTVLKDIWFKGAFLYYKLTVINKKFNKEGCRYTPLDNNLIYMMAGRLKKEIALLSKLTVDEIAYNLSEYINQNEEYFNLSFDAKIILYEENMCEKKYKRIVEEHYRFFLLDMKNDINYDSIWFKASLLYDQLISTNKIFGKAITNISVDDKLIYMIAERLNKNMIVLYKASTEQTAYFISLNILR
jgi:hypothetical protein